jgi:hypothetical protein
MRATAGISKWAHLLYLDFFSIIDPQSTEEVAQLFFSTDRLTCSEVSESPIDWVLALEVILVIILYSKY